MKYKSKDDNNNEICKRFTNHLIHPLFKINEEEKVVEFNMRTSTLGNFGLIELFEDDKKSLLKINFNKSVIEFFEMEKNVSYSKDYKFNLLEISAKILITMRLNKYFVLTSILVMGFPNFYYKLFPKDWWNGKLFEKTQNAHLLIHGDFVKITPINVQIFKEEDIYWVRILLKCMVTYN
uniref:Uncharacterized protein n=1 Tax=Meloidogyne hapla TaxID=6305 RepID=A0A1I8AXF5_MELHA